MGKGPFLEAGGVPCGCQDPGEEGWDGQREVKQHLWLFISPRGRGCRKDQALSG